MGPPARRDPQSMLYNCARDGFANSSNQTEIQAYGEFSRIPSISELRASFFGITVAAFLPVSIYIHRATLAAFKAQNPFALGMNMGLNGSIAGLTFFGKLQRWHYWRSYHLSSLLPLIEVRVGSSLSLSDS